MNASCLPRLQGARQLPADGGDGGVAAASRELPQVAMLTLVVRVGRAKTAHMQLQRCWQRGGGEALTVGWPPPADPASCVGGCHEKISDCLQTLPAVSAGEGR